MIAETTRASESRSCLVKVEPGEATETGWWGPLGESLWEGP